MVTDEGSTGSENVAEIGASTGTLEAPATGDDEVTVGASVSAGGGAGTKVTSTQ